MEQNSSSSESDNIEIKIETGLLKKVETRGRKEIKIPNDVLEQIIEWRELGYSYKAIGNSLRYYKDVDISNYTITKAVKAHEVIKDMDLSEST